MPSTGSRSATPLSAVRYFISATAGPMPTRPSKACGCSSCCGSATPSGSTTTSARVRPGGSRPLPPTNPSGPVSATSTLTDTAWKMGLPLERPTLVSACLVMLYRWPEGP
jgi:hypothetical protein